MASFHLKFHKRRWRRVDDAHGERRRFAAHIKASKFNACDKTILLARLLFRALRQKARQGLDLLYYIYRPAAYRRLSPTLQASGEIFDSGASIDS